MKNFQVTFSIKNGMFPFTETVKAESIHQVPEAVKQLTKEAGVSLKQILSIVEI